MRTARRAVWTLLLGAAVLVVLWVLLSQGSDVSTSRHVSHSVVPPHLPAVPADTRPVSDHVPARDEQRFLACIDLLHGGRLSGFALEFDFEQRLLSIETDSEGIARIPSNARPVDFVGSLSPVSPDWRLLGTDEASGTQHESPTGLYFCRNLTLEGRVRTEDGTPLMFDTVELTYEIVGDEPRGDVRVPRSVWLREHDVPLSGTLGSAREDGTFAADVPRLAGLVVHARAPNWTGASVAIEPREGDVVRHVDLELRRGTQVSGRLLDEDGAPLAGVSVMLYLSVRDHHDRLTLAEAMRLRGGMCGMSYRSSPEDNEAVATFAYQVITDSSGNYRASVRQQGELVVRAHVPDRAPATFVTRPVCDVKSDLVARQGATDTVQILVDGVPAIDTAIEIVQVSRGMPQMGAPTLRTDSRGFLRTQWLEVGQAYVISAGRDFKEFVEWKRQDAIRIVPLSKKGFQLLPKGWW